MATDTLIRKNRYSQLRIKILTIRDKNPYSKYVLITDHIINESPKQLLLFYGIISKTQLTRSYCSLITAITDYGPRRQRDLLFAYSLLVKSRDSTFILKTNHRNCRNRPVKTDMSFITKECLGIEKQFRPERGNVLSKQVLTTPYQLQLEHCSAGHSLHDTYINTWTRVH